MNATPHSSRTSVTLVLDRAAVGSEPTIDPAPATTGARSRAAGGPRPERQVLVLGHRGLPGPRRGENTVPAVEAALSSGADGVEVDARLSSDGVLVCSHSPVVRAASGQVLPVTSTAARQLRQAARDRGEGLATVPEVLAAVSRHRECRLVIEVKPVEDHTTALRTVRALDAALGSGPFSGVNLTISSFDQVLLGLVRSRIGGGEVRTALLGHEAEPAHSVLRRAVSGGHDDAHLNVAALERAPHVVTLAHHLGVGVTAWTVNRRDDLRRVVRWGVDAVITDNIVAARVLVGEAAGASSAQVARGTAC